MSVNPIFRMSGIDPRHLRFRFWKNGTLLNRLSRAYGKIRTTYAWQRAVTECGRALDWVRRDNFLILSAARSGTTLLVDYLNCHPRIRCRGEILNSDYAYYGNPRHMGPERLRLQVESFFVRRAGTLAGAKVLTYQFDELQIKLADMIEILHDPAVIVLYREQILEQYVSLKTAERDRVWHSNKPFKNEPIRLDPALFVEFVKRERRMWRENLAVLNGRRVHYLTYDQLANETEETIRSLFGFLGLKAYPVHSPLVKLNRAPLSQRLVNYRDFVQGEVRAYTSLRLPFPELSRRTKAA